MDSVWIGVGAVLAVLAVVGWRLRQRAARRKAADTGKDIYPMW